jgi:hypothetical protein
LAMTRVAVLIHAVCRVSDRLSQLTRSMSRRGWPRWRDRDSDRLRRKSTVQRTGVVERARECWRRDSQKAERDCKIKRAAARGAILAQVFVCTSFFREITTLSRNDSRDSLPRCCSFLSRHQDSAREILAAARLTAQFPAIMTQDDDRFVPRLGRSRRDNVRTPTTLHSMLMRRVARAGGNPRRLPSALPRTQMPSPSTGRFNARGRGAKIAATFPRASGWSFDPGSGGRVRSRRVTVKVRIVKLAAGKASEVQAHLRYLEREGVSREGEPGRLYSTFTDEADRDAFIDRGREDRHQFRIILSPEDRAAYADLKPFTRDVMAQMEADLGTTLDWVAVDHHDTGHYAEVRIMPRGRDWRLSRCPSGMRRSA